tara:strand:+ start:768 stop:1466 length:699 start_codon:yes stop_codon:yes gene_type:complete
MKNRRKEKDNQYTNQLKALAITFGLLVGTGKVANLFIDDKPIEKNLEQITFVEPSQETPAKNYVLNEVNDSSNYAEKLVEVEPTSYKIANFSKDDDKSLLARMIFGEARNCSETERVAVGYSAINRVNDGKRWNGETISEVLLKDWQYSCFNKNDPNRNKLLNPEAYDAESFYECLEVAEEILSGKLKDPTNGATHYFNPASANPSWADKLEKIGKIKTEKGISKHEFYRED